MALPCRPITTPILQRSLHSSSPSSPSFSPPLRCSPLPSLPTGCEFPKYSCEKPGKEGEWLPDLRLPVYSTYEAIEKMREASSDQPDEEHPYRAMYSSLLGGIILNPALMTIPIDDHMVHRGHGVFDTTMLINGYLYNLDSHLDRFLKSATAAKITPPYPPSTIRRILLLLSAASKLKTGSVRYWLSSGPGDFSLSPPAINPRPAFYSVVINTNFTQELEGVKVITSTIPMKPPKFATMKNVNYLPNVLSKMEAEEKGAFASIWVDEDRCIAEGPNANIAFVSRERELILPKPDRILHGCTAKRLLMLGKKLVGKGILKSVESRDVSVEEAKSSSEMMFVSSLIPIMPVVEWDGDAIGDGNVGEVTQAVSELLWEDIIAGPEMLRTEVPY